MRNVKQEEQVRKDRAISIFEHTRISNYTDVNVDV